MNTQPTPITDAFAIKFVTVCGEKYWVPVDIARKLESERDEARATCSELVTDSDAITLARTVVRITQERDEARGELAGIENKMRVELGGHPDSELWGEAGLIGATMRCVDALGEVTDQRDHWKARCLQQNKDLGYELRDPNGTIWSECKRLQSELTRTNEYADKLAAGLPDGMLPKDVEVLREANLGLAVELTAVTEQRDRLVKVIKAASVLIAAKGRHNTMLAYNGLRDALQSLTLNPEP